MANVSTGELVIAESEKDDVDVQHEITSVMSHLKSLLLRSKIPRSNPLRLKQIMAAGNSLSLSGSGSGSLSGSGSTFIPCVFSH